MKLVHMSDIHLTAPGKTIGGRDPRHNFERALTDILKCHHDAELLVITGDLSDWGDRDDYEWLKARLDSFPVPVRLCIGNHDRRANFLSVFPDYAGSDGFAHGVYDTAAGRCLFLDTVEPKPMPAAFATCGSNGWRRGCPNIPGRFCSSCTTTRCQPISNQWTG